MGCWSLDISLPRKSGDATQIAMYIRIMKNLNKVKEHFTIHLSALALCMFEWCWRNTREVPKLKQPVCVEDRKDHSIRRRRGRCRIDAHLRGHSRS